jgi:hypothetical protein
LQPFGVFERVLAHPNNADVKRKFSMLQDALRDKCLTSLCNYNVTLEEMRNVSDIIVGLLEAPPELHSKLVAACPTIGGTGEELVTYNEACFDGLKALWARK